MNKFVRLLVIIFSIFSLTQQSLAQLSDIDPEILKKLKFVNENGKIIVEVDMASLLTLALQRSTVVDILAVNEEIAEEKLLADREIYNPVLNTSIGIQRQISPSSTNLSTTSSSPYLSFTASDMTSFSTSWNKKDSRGILYSLSYQKISRKTSLGDIQNQGDSLSDWLGVDDHLYIDQVTTAIKIPIFKDWGNINRHPEYKSIIGLEETKLQSRKTKLELINSIANIYWDLVWVEKNIQALEASVILAEQFVKDTKTRQQLGVLDSIEVKQSESQLARVRQNLQQEIVLKKQIEDQIRAVLNLEDLPYSYRPVERLYVRQDEFDFDKLMIRIYNSSQEIKLFNAGLKMNKLDYREAINQGETDLDLSLQYTLNGFGGDFSGAAAGMSESKLHDYQIALSWSVPLFDRATSQKIKQVRLKKERLHLRINNLKLQLKVNLQATLRNMKLAEQGIKLANTSVDLVKQLLHKEIEKFKVGSNTSFRVAQVQQDLVNAQKNEILAKIQYEKTFLSYLILTEQIFSYYHLEE